MSRFATRDELINEASVEYRKLEEILAKLRVDQMEVPGPCGEWSVKDILAHLTEWHQMVLRWYRAGERGEVFKTPSEDLNWGQLPALNQRIFVKHRDRPLAEILAEFRGSHAETVDLVGAISEDSLLQPGFYRWTGKNALVSYFGSSTCSHYRWARELIRKWLKTQPA